MLHHCTGSSVPWRWHSHTCGGVWEEDIQGAAPCEGGEESLEVVVAGESNLGEVEEAGEEGRKVLEDAWMCQSAVKSLRWVGRKRKGPLFVMVWVLGTKRVRNLR